MFGVGTFSFLADVSYAHQDCIYFLITTVKKILQYCEVSLQFKITVFYFNILYKKMYSSDEQAELSLYSLVSHDHSEIILISWFCLKNHFF